MMKSTNVIAAKIATNLRPSGCIGLMKVLVMLRLMAVYFPLGLCVAHRPQRSECKAASSSGPVGYAGVSSVIHVSPYLRLSSRVNPGGGSSGAFSSQTIMALGVNQPPARALINAACPMPLP